MSARRIRQLLATILLAPAYTAVMLNWLWVMIVGLPRLVESGTFDMLIKPQAQAPETVHTDMFAASPLAWALVGLVTLGVLMITIVVLIRLPRTIVQTGQKIVDQTAEAVLPAITHHKPLPPKKKLILSRRLVLMIQAVLALLPLVICLFLPPYHEMTRQIIVTIALLLSGLSLVSFALSWWVSPALTSRTRSHASRG